MDVYCCVRVYQQSDPHHQWSVRLVDHDSNSYSYNYSYQIYMQLQDSHWDQTCCYRVQGCRMTLYGGGG